MTHLKSIYDVWDGNAEALASDIEEQGVTVRQWRNRGNIPTRYWAKIIKAAATRGVTLEVQQFVALDEVEELGHGSGVTASYGRPSPGIAEEISYPVAAQGEAA